MHNDDNTEQTISMLLDVEHLYGEHEGRLAPILTTLIVALLPVLLFVYFGMFEWFPIWLFVPIEIIFAVRIILLIPGRENFRLANYRKRMYDDYTSPATYMQLKTIYEDGLVEYVNGKVFYAVKCYNGTCEDQLQRTKQLRKFIVSLVGEYDFDTYILNDSKVGPIRRYYNTVQRFGKNTAATNFTEIVDLMVNKTRDKSMVQCTVIVIKGTRSDWKQMKLQIDGAVTSQMAKAFKSVSRVDNKDELLEIINLDLDTSVNIEELLRAKYKSGEYYTSKVVAYDPSEEIIIGNQEVIKEPVKEVIKRSTFHVPYVEEESHVSNIIKATPKHKEYEAIIIGGNKIEENNTGNKTEQRTSKTTEKKTKALQVRKR